MGRWSVSSIIHTGTPCHTGPHGGTSTLVRRYTGGKEGLRPECRKSKAGYSNSLGLVCLDNPGVLWAKRMVSRSLTLVPGVTVSSTRMAQCMA